VLEAKVRAAAAEWELRRDEAQEMMQRYKEADANRFALLSELRRQGARTRIDSAMGGTPLDDFSRAEEKIEHDSAYADALEEMGGPPPPPPPPPPPGDDASPTPSRRGRRRPPRRTQAAHGDVDTAAPRVSER
jgi:hypothetical protein